MRVRDSLQDSRLRRDIATTLLGGFTVLLAGALGLAGSTGLPPLRLVASVIVVLLTLGLAAGAIWPVTAAVTLLVIEWAGGLVAGSVPSAWAPSLAAGLYLLVESGVTVLERRDIVEAPVEPAMRRIVSVVATSLVVWAVAALVLELSRLDVSNGSLTQIAGVAAAAAVGTTLSWLLRKRVMP